MVCRLKMSMGTVEVGGARSCVSSTGASNKFVKLEGERVIGIIYPIFLASRRL
jgi:hypothetical protein